MLLAFSFESQCPKCFYHFSGYKRCLFHFAASGQQDEAAQSGEGSGQTGSGPSRETRERKGLRRRRAGRDNLRQYLRRLKDPRIPGEVGRPATQEIFPVKPPGLASLSGVSSAAFTGLNSKLSDRANCTSQVPAAREANRYSPLHR